MDKAINPNISVVMSIYNAEKYLAEAIDSILNQTYFNFEFIIINDGSTDKSLKIIEKYQEKDKRIVLINRVNKGLIYSLNEGIKLAKGDYIARMDGDDISLPTRFEEQISFLDKNSDIGVCGSWIEIFAKNKKSNIKKFAKNNQELKAQLLFSSPVAHPSAMIRKSILDKHSISYKKKYKNAEDYKFWLDLSKVTKLANIQKVLLRYRYLETSITRVSNNKSGQERFIVISSIFLEILREMAITNSDMENKLHFIMNFSERMKVESIDLQFLQRYVCKLIDANKKAKLFREKHLLELVCSRFLFVLYHQVKKRNYTSLRVLKSRFFYTSLRIVAGKYL
jgi:glycosyltransferase involved in cell wall biosynthesis